ncbi:MAG: Hsp20/alpha crystallin family protein [Desulfobacterota bacterium]|nr:Hsp20/alpha crystallin family protein [Thermodesulfobacteriota bacterium]MDW8001702.1 Hsp20/alpha crystallin family protein [Deltaproteobacteria bacterium]
MPLTPWRSIWESDLLSIKEEMDRIFDEFFGRPIFPVIEETPWVFPIDVFETPSDIVVYADLPAVDPRDVSITVSEDKLTIRGERKKVEDVDIESFFRKERFYGFFQRIIPLPTEVEAKRAKASYKDGVLKIVIPKLQKDLPKEIKIEIE